MWTMRQTHSQMPYTSHPTQERIITMQLTGQRAAHATPHRLHPLIAWFGARSQQSAQRAQINQIRASPWLLVGFDRSLQQGDPAGGQRMKRNTRTTFLVWSCLAQLLIVLYLFAFFMSLLFACRSPFHEPSVLSYARSAILRWWPLLAFFRSISPP